MAKNVQVNIQISYADDWIKIEVPVSAFAIKAVRIKFKTDAVTNVYLDRLELLAKSYFTNTLTLEKLTTELTKDYALSEGEFGKTFETIYDTISEEVSEGDTALSIVAKQ